MLDNKTYDALRWVVSIVLPSLVTLIGTIGNSIGWPQTEITMTIIGAITVFLGTVLGVSNAQYRKEEDK